MQKDANLVELEKCCQTHILLQNFVLIQPRTSPLKICKIFEKCIFRKCRSAPSAASGRWSSGPSPGSGRRAARSAGRRARAPPGAGIFEKCIFEKFANFWRARSRLYQNEILQENMRSTAFFKLYKICILFAPLRSQNFSQKIGLKKQQFSWNFSKKNCKCRKICKILSNFKNFSLRIW